MSTNTGNNLSTDSLHKELQSKNEVIAALTEQLEVTADQLDRLQRSGVRNNERESSGRTGLGLTGQVESALEYIDELDPAAHFERLEIGIEQILEMLSSRTISGQVEEVEETESAPDKESIDSSDDDDFWKATKERLLQNSEQVETPENGEPSTSASNRLDAGIVPQTTEGKRVPLPPLADPPKPIEALYGSAALEEAITERDSYIVSLIARLRVLEESQFPPINWVELSTAPEKLKASLISLEMQLRDNLLRSEVSVALERASLTRERSKLFYVKRQLEQEVKRIGLSSIVDSQNQEGENGQNSRWAKFFDAEQ